MANILLVEDSQTVRNALADALIGLGHKVFHASNGLEGLKIAHSRAIHLVVTDLTLPQLDGVSLIRTLRAAPGHSQTPILVITGLRGKVQQEALAAGATECAQKPLEPEAATRIIQRLLGRLTP